MPKCTFESLDELECVLGERCCTLASRPEVIRAHALFHGWPRTRYDD